MCVRDASPSIPRPRNHHCSSSDWLLHFHVCMDNTHVIANTHIHTIAHVQRHGHCRTHYPTHIVTLICIFLPYKHTYSCRHSFVTTIAPQIQLGKPTYSQCLQSRGLRPSTQALGGQAWPEEPLQEQRSGQAGPRRDLGERWGVRRGPLWLWTQHCSEQCFLRARQGQSSLPSSYFVTCHRQWPA